MNVDDFYFNEYDEEEGSDESCEECGGYHGHNPWCSEYDPAYTGDNNDW